MRAPPELKEGACGRARPHIYCARAPRDIAIIHPVMRTAAILVRKDAYIFFHRSLIITLMSSAATLSRFRTARALLILGGLLSLCISEGVGPRLVPLPAAPELAAATRRDGREATAARTTSHGKSTALHEAMIPQTHKRWGAERQPLPLATHGFNGGLAHACDARALSPNVYPPLHTVSAPASRPAGRAPPRLA